MYPHTEIELVDNSQYKEIPIAQSSSSPTAMAAFLSDRGTEDLTLYKGSSWFYMYGDDLNVEKYGQAKYQAAQVIQKGGRIYSKRIVAPDASLANLLIYVKVQKVTTTVDDKTITSVNLKYGSVSAVNNSNDIDRVASLAENLLPEAASNNEVVLPLYLITSMGRGSWSPKIRITPDYRISRGSGFAKYLFEIVDPDNYKTSTESFFFTASPNAVEKNLNVALDMVAERESSLVRIQSWNDSLESMPKLIESILGLATDSLANVDFLFGKDLRGNQISNITTDFTAFNPQEIFGNELKNGSDGSFATNALTSTYYAQELNKFFNGTYTEEIYNLDSMTVDFILDANYPDSVKRTIEEFVTWRQDCYFIRDLGLEIYGVVDIEEKERSVLHNMFSGSYCNSMMVLDDETRRYIHVTIPYLIAALLTVHFINGCNRPFAGARYGVYWMYGSQIKRGSINFLPKVTPYIDEKTTLDDLGVNYVSIYNGTNVVMETFYTGQHYSARTQFDFAYNVWNVQRVIKALRVQCPKSRYAFLKGDDFTDYQMDINNCLSQYTNSFMTFSMVYEADTAYENQNIYYATLEVSFIPVAQAEKFKITAISA